jgi:hypothetical protein
MEIYLTIKEQDRENALFSPREIFYPLPEGLIDLWTFVADVPAEELVVQQPLSC